MKIICLCSEAKLLCETICDRWKNKNKKPDQVFRHNKWPKRRVAK